MPKRKPPTPTRVVEDESYIGPYRLNEAGYPVARYDLYDSLPQAERDHWRNSPGRWMTLFANSKRKISV